MNRACMLSALMIIGAGACALAQNKDKGKLIEVPKGGFYDSVVLKDQRHVDDSLSQEPPKMKFIMDQSGLKLPNKVDLYKRQWANPPISQGNAGTCWDFSTSSFYESEIYRMQKKQVKLSEMYFAYWEYVGKARRFVQERGKSLFDEGSEANALSRLAKEYGMMPETEYKGLLNGRKYYSHAAMVKEMKSYLESVKQNNAWNEEAVIATIRDILKHYMGEPPAKFKVDGKEYTPMSYMKNYLKFNPEDYVDILSYKEKPFLQKVEYDVPDNWWHNRDYYNVPLDDFMKALKQAIRNGYTVAIGGDVSEAGFSRDTQCAKIPDFDIPSAYINDDARQFRFSNKTTTDDHGMHLVGYVENYNGDGKDWYLVKDSGAGSKNNDPKAPEFGYYFFSEDYVKLKMMDFAVHKDAVKELLGKFK
ncbi:C1 family peptidase [Parabacteroides sp. FAFU027]|uniref:C1 family peptidase n=1 Tax=Parabacteroides sp. FAFU027 TaxID=2922715 RepID=UPI001FAF628D|nr:C1 family peptidase [Parabacteroides sp. FAFU027]